MDARAERPQAGSGGVWRLAIVEDHIVLREGLASLLQAQPDFEVVGEAGSVAEAVAMAEACAPDLILMDYGLPDGSGVEAMKAILKERPETQVVFLTVEEGDEMLVDALRAGAKGYLLKNVPVASLMERLRALARGEAALTRQMMSRVLEAFTRTTTPPAAERKAFEELTQREAEVLAELVRGASNQEIADELFISVSTVKNHVHSILQKLEVGNRREAARLAVKHGYG